MHQFPIYLHIPKRSYSFVSLLEYFGSRLETLVAELIGKMRDKAFGTAVVPNDSIAQRLARFAIPSYGCLTLVCDT